jgi:hypothetical protein
MGMIAGFLVYFDLASGDGLTEPSAVAPDP